MEGYLCGKGVTLLLHAAAVTPASPHACRRGLGARAKRRAHERQVTSPPACERDAAGCLATNVLGTAHVASLCARCAARSLRGAGAGADGTARGQAGDQACVRVDGLRV